MRCKPGCTCSRHRKCPVGCTCDRHIIRSVPCVPGCRCGLHNLRTKLCIDCGAHRPRHNVFCNECYAKRLEAQDNKCFLCQKTFTSDKVTRDGVRRDHDHRCPDEGMAPLETPGGRKYGGHGRSGCPICFRGLICAGCNWNLGWLEANFDTIMAYKDSRLPAIKREIRRRAKEQ